MVSCIKRLRSASRTSQAVDEITPLNAGLMLLPYSLGSSLASMPVAWFLSYQQKRTSNTSGQKWAICVGLLISTLGFGKTAFAVVIIDNRAKGSQVYCIYFNSTLQLSCSRFCL